jgi:pimeloyl-ACP methyl ester carboxylesterase
MPRLSPVTGRYVRVDVDGAQYNVFYEENGEGIPLVCQHTAGCHNRQWRYLLEDPDLTKSFRVIAYDLPRHGKSDPPGNQEWWKEEYRLTTSHFVNFIVAFCKELELESPIFMGSSFGGCVALHLAHDHPEYFRAIIALEAAEYRPGFYNDWFHHPHVNSQDVNSYGVMGLMAVPPLISEQDRRATVFYYSQGAPGVLKGDLYFYSVDHDMRHSVHEIDTSKCMVYMLTGEYDYLTTTKMSKETCDKIKGAQFIEMKELGHFPMSESEPAFKRYITPVLEEVRSRALASTSR